ncbi:MAG: hypothetical protein H6512_15175 [Acidimicrobiia bacterium]|nr:hypothetical protein [Acidimicrobiia bacterium]
MDIPLEVRVRDRDRGVPVLEQQTVVAPVPKARVVDDQSRRHRIDAIDWAADMSVECVAAQSCPHNIAPCDEHVGEHDLGDGVVGVNALIRMPRDEVLNPLTPELRNGGSVTVIPDSSMLPAGPDAGGRISKTWYRSAEPTSRLFPVTVTAPTPAPTILSGLSMRMLSST